MKVAYETITQTLQDYPLTFMRLFLYKCLTETDFAFKEGKGYEQAILGLKDLIDGKLTKTELTLHYGDNYAEYPTKRLLSFSNNLGVDFYAFDRLPKEGEAQVEKVYEETMKQLYGEIGPEFFTFDASDASRPPAL